MSSFIRDHLRPAAGALLVLTLLTGVAYPLAITAFAGTVFPAQANGSLVSVDGRAVGSVLIGQSFTHDRYLWGRLSAAGDGYDADASSGSNLGPTSETLIDRVASDVDRFRAANGDVPIPVDLITTSGSGLDPHVSPAAAAYQVARIASARGMDPAAVQAIVARHTEGALLGFIGAPRVNVLLVNLDLDGLLTT